MSETPEKKGKRDHNRRRNLRILNGGPEPGTKEKSGDEIAN